MIDRKNKKKVISSCASPAFSPLCFTQYASRGASTRLTSKHPRVRFLRSPRPRRENCAEKTTTTTPMRASSSSSLLQTSRQSKRASMPLRLLGSQRREKSPGRRGSGPGGAGPASSAAWRRGRGASEAQAKGRRFRKRKRKRAKELDEEFESERRERRRGRRRRKKLDDAQNFVFFFGFTLKQLAPSAPSSLLLPPLHALAFECF